MTLRTLAVFASLVLAACTRGSSPDDIDCPSSTECGNDTDSTPANDPFEGDNLVAFTIAPVFDGVGEECNAAVTCESADGTVRTIEGNTATTFEADADASCGYVLGNEDCNGRSCHQDANGLLWTKSADLPSLEDGMVVEAEGNWWFGAPVVTCTVDGTHIEGDPFEMHDLYVDTNDRFEITGVAFNGSWLQIDGAQFDFGGVKGSAGYRVEHVEFGPNTLLAEYTDLGHYTLDCWW